MQKKWKQLIFIVVIFILLFTNRIISSGDELFMRQREEMVRTQIEQRGITDKRVLSAMRKVPRHAFVLLTHKMQAYVDRPLPIGEGQTISQPYIVALMTESLKLSPTCRVLEIGTGSGYQAAILAEICQQIYTIEIIPELAKRAEETLRGLGYENITIKTGDGYKGWTEHAPFDAIIVTAAPEKIPEQLVEQLIDGGRMVLPVGKTEYQQLILLTKEGEIIKKEFITPVRFVPMVHGKEP
ncbi:MAG: protein-L-isoaspartate(D-aspartate) O-methyltransferase [Candidatus Omnitrophota bacterium]